MDYENNYDFENRVVAPEYVPEDSEVENPLRPKVLSEYIGQDKVKENLSVFIEAAKLRKESLDHENERFQSADLQFRRQGVSA